MKTLPVRTFKTIIIAILAATTGCGGGDDEGTSPLSTRGLDPNEVVSDLSEEDSETLCEIATDAFPDEAAVAQSCLFYARDVDPGWGGDCELALRECLSEGVTDRTRAYRAEALDECVNFRLYASCDATVAEAVSCYEVSPGYFRKLAPTVDCDGFDFSAATQPAACARLEALCP